MHRLVLVLTCLGVVEGGGRGRDCPAVCRCEDVGIVQKVDCVEIGLRSVPSNLSSFTTSLDVSMNELSEVSANAFIGLHCLVELRLAGNSVTKICRDAFTGLTSLNLLTLHNNHIKTVLPGALEDLKNLRSLRLDANSISRLSASSFRGLMSLRHLWLSDNIMMEVPVLALSTLVELQALTLALNNISFVPDLAFSSLSQLLVLHLQYNRIRSVGRKSFDGLHNLDTLDLSFNRINSLPAAIKPLSSLRDLNLKNNNIPVIPEHAFSGNPSIQIINLQNNPIHTVGHSSFRLQLELRMLSLSGSSITDFPNFTGSIKLEVLSITDSHISTLPNICEQLPNLHTFDLSHNLIHSLPSFSSCRKIQTIDLSSNHLSPVSLRTLTHLGGSGHLQLRVSNQHLHRLRDPELQFVPRNQTSPIRSPSTCRLDSSLKLLHLSIFFILLLFLLMAPSPSSRRLLFALLLWFCLMVGVSWSSILSPLDHLCVPGPDTNHHSTGVFLLCLSSEVGVLVVLMVVVFRTKSCTQISLFSLTVFLLTAMLEVTLCSSLRFLLNTSCFLLVLTGCRCRKEVRSSQRRVCV